MSHSSRPAAAYQSESQFNGNYAHTAPPTHQYPPPPSPPQARRAPPPPPAIGMPEPQPYQLATPASTDKFSFASPSSATYTQQYVQEASPDQAYPASQTYPHQVQKDPNGEGGPHGDENGHGHHFPVHVGHHGVFAESEDELTEEERVEYEKGIMTWKKAKNWRFWIRKEWTWYYIALIVVVVVVALMAFFHHSIINWLTPFTRRLESIKYGWLIPVAILFVLSFPPLFGNEIVMVLIGIVWGLGIGFAITAVGMALGEIANYFVFKYWCSARAGRIAKKNLNYACLAQVIRDGGFWMAFTIRLSVIPTHLSTVMFAVCGLKFWQYCLALIAGLPKQLIAVYVGVVLGGSEGDTSGHTSTAIISDTVFGVTALVTIWSLWYIYKKMVAVRKPVLLAMRKDLVSKGVKVDEFPAEMERA